MTVTSQACALVVALAWDNFLLGTAATAVCLVQLLQLICYICLLRDF